MASMQSQKPINHHTTTETCQHDNKNQHNFGDKLKEMGHSVTKVFTAHKHHEHHGHGVGGKAHTGFAHHEKKEGDCGGKMDGGHYKKERRTKKRTTKVGKCNNGSSSSDSEYEVYETKIVYEKKD